MGSTALYADLARYYQVDLAEVWRDPAGLSPRRVVWLVEHLPEDSATVAILRGGIEHRSWTSTAHLLATVVDAVQLNTWATVAASSKRRPRPPHPVPRPDTTRRSSARVVTVAQLAAAEREATTRG